MHVKPENLKWRNFEAATSDISTVDGKRCLRVAFSSETPVLRTGDGEDYKKGEPYYEVLDHSEDSADLSLLQNGGAFIDEHDWSKQIGSIQRAWIDPDKKGRADLTFANTPLGDERWSLMSGGHRKDISFGYIYTRKLGEGVHTDGKPIIRYGWSAHEITSTAVGADHFGTGVGRSLVDFPPKVTEEIKTTNFMAEKIEAAGTANAVDENKIRGDARSMERQRVSEISKIADVLTKDHPHCADKIRSITSESIASETSLADFQIRAMKEVLNAKPVEPVLMEDMGLSETEKRCYSVIRGIQSCLRSKTGKIEGCLEAEVSQELSRRSGQEFEGFGVPHDAKVRLSQERSYGKRRDMSVSVFNQGGATVQTTVVTPIIELLRNRMVTDKLGITVMSGLTSNVAIPRQTAAAIAYSLAESATLTKSTQALDQILLTPHRVGAYNDYTRQLLLQSSIDVENFIRDDLMKVIAIKWDYLILNGQGAGSEPLGIMATPGVSAVLFGAAATYSKMVEFETDLAQYNADAGTMAYVTTPSVRGKLKTAGATLTGATTVAAGPYSAIWTPGENSGEGAVNGYRALASNQVPNNQVIFGNWNEVIHGLYGGYDIIVNPYSRDTDAAVRITVNTFGDVAIRHPQSFAVSSDAGNQ